MQLLTVYSLWFDWAVLLGFLNLEVSLSDVCRVCLLTGAMPCDRIGLLNFEHVMM